LIFEPFILLKGFHTLAHSGRPEYIQRRALCSDSLESIQTAKKGRKKMTQGTSVKVQRMDECRWRIPREGKMRVEGLVYASERMMEDIRKDQSLVQVANVAALPGIVGRSLAMPDIHWGYGFPIGGVAAFDVEGGVISPGGVGYDIN
jgi:hypothetical protein